ncbi:MAG: IS21-like element helper ATPase IstB [Pseudomonadota bacterium]
MDDNLDQLLTNLRLKRIRQILERELERAAKKQPSYADFLAGLLREQYHFRQAQSLEYRISKACLPEPWTLETFPFNLQPGVRRSTIMQLAELDFIPKAQNIVMIGDAGVGKTGLAVGIMLKALENGYRGRFVKAQDLFDEMYASLADRSTRSLVRKLANIDLLVVDELGYLTIRPEQANIFFKLMDERYCRKATIVTTNLEYDDWYGFLGNKKMVEALLDRIRHHCFTISIKGPSIRDLTSSTPTKMPTRKKRTSKKRKKK